MLLSPGPRIISYQYTMRECFDAIHRQVICIDRDVHLFFIKQYKPGTYCASINHNPRGILARILHRECSRWLASVHHFPRPDPVETALQPGHGAQIDLISNSILLHYSGRTHSLRHGGLRRHEAMCIPRVSNLADQCQAQAAVAHIDWQISGCVGEDRQSRLMHVILCSPRPFLIVLTG